MTKQLISSLLLVSTSLALAIPSLSLADCNQWQSNPASVNVNDLANTDITAVKDCMSSCADLGLSASNSDLTPALCMQNVSYVEYLTQFANNNANAANTTLSSSSSSSVSSTAVKPKSKISSDIFCSPYNFLDQTFIC